MYKNRVLPNYKKIKHELKTQGMKDDRRNREEKERKKANLFSIM
jgi:hypothetical protein